jgi:DnaJ-class molecular chaperone
LSKKEIMKEKGKEQIKSNFSNHAVISITDVCIRCNGTGYLPQFMHVEAGVCFRCRGKRTNR